VFPRCVLVECVVCVECPKGVDVLSVKRVCNATHCGFVFFRDNSV